MSFESKIKDMGNLIEEIPNYWVGIESRGFLFASTLAFSFWWWCKDNS